MIKTNDTTYNIAKSVKCLVIKSDLSLFLKENKVAFNERNQMDTLKYLSIIIKICFIYVKKKKKTSINTFKEMI